MKTRLLALCAAFALTGCGIAMSSAWSHTGLSYANEKDGWRVSAKTLSGSASRNVGFNEQSLRNLYMDCTLNGGTVTLRLTQGDAEAVKTVDGEFSGFIDTAGLKNGKVKVRLEFEKAEGVDVYLSW